MIPILNGMSQLAEETTFMQAMKGSKALEVILMEKDQREAELHKKIEE